MLLAFSQFDFSYDTLVIQASRVHNRRASRAPGSLLADPVTATSMGLGLMFGTAGLPHILMRFLLFRTLKKHVNQCSMPRFLSLISLM